MSHLYPTKNCEAGTARSPVPLPSATKEVPLAIHSGLRSEMGLPVTMLPPTPDTLRIWLPANHLIEGVRGVRAGASSQQGAAWGRELGAGVLRC